MPANTTRPNPLFPIILAILGSLAPLMTQDGPLREFARTMDRVGTNFSREVAEAASQMPISEDAPSPAGPISTKLSARF